MLLACLFPLTYFVILIEFRSASFMCMFWEGCMKMSEKPLKNEHCLIILVKWYTKESNVLGVNIIYSGSSYLAAFYIFIVLLEHSQHWQLNSLQQREAERKHSTNIYLRPALSGKDKEIMGTLLTEVGEYSLLRAEYYPGLHWNTWSSVLFMEISNNFYKTHVDVWKERMKWR